MYQSNTRDTIEALRTYTGQPWAFRDGQFRSAPLPPQVAERMLTHDKIPATQITSGEKDHPSITLSLTAEAARGFIEDMQRERSSLGKGA